MTRIKMPNDNNLKYNNVLGMESIKKKKSGFWKYSFCRASVSKLAELYTDLEVRQNMIWRF